jgi:ATPase subunit of ABC transporter with duplicated ATPase domains
VLVNHFQNDNGRAKPDSGEFSIGDTVKSLMLIKHLNINPDKSIWENFADGQELIMMGGKQVNSRAYLSRFNFGGEQNKKHAFWWRTQTVCT